MYIDFVSDWPAYLFMVVFVVVILYIVIKQSRKSAGSVKALKSKK